MPSLTKLDYQELGRRVARKEAQAPTLREGSWQAKAFHEGWLAETARMRGKRGPRKPQDAPKPAGAGDVPTRAGEALERPRFAINSQELARATQHWPSGAREHVLRLAADFNVEKRLARRNRLRRAVTRMVLRHSGSKLASALTLSVAPVEAGA